MLGCYMLQHGTRFTGGRSGSSMRRAEDCDRMHMCADVSSRFESISCRSAPCFSISLQMLVGHESMLRSGEGGTSGA